jgi:cysteine desulfurase
VTKTTGGDPEAPAEARSPGYVYLDAASSEPLHPAARDTLLAALDAGYADPRTLHNPGRNARLLFDNARAVVADGFGVREDEVTFTSSGTQAVHLGVLGLLTGRARTSRRLVHSPVEHSAVLQAGAWWTGQGGTTHPLEVDGHGRVEPSSVEHAVAGGAGDAGAPRRSAAPPSGRRGGSTCDSSNASTA